jgi:hypothetical protein
MPILGLYIDLDQLRDEATPLELSFFLCFWKFGTHAMYPWVIMV